MAVLSFPDDVLQEAGLSERDALVEFACRLYDAGKLSLWSAAKLTGLDRPAIEDALLERGIPIHRPERDDLLEDLASLDSLGI